MLYWVIVGLIAFTIGLQVLARYEMSVQRARASRRTGSGRSKEP